MNPTPKPDPGVFRDPDVEAGTGAWHVWVGADSDDLWVRVNPTENLSAKVRMVEPNKACNAPAKAEVRTGANGLKAVKIGRGQRFTRGQAQRIPGDNHKVVKGSKRAAEEELGCVPKCRKCEVLPKTPTCKVKVGGQCFVGETSVRWSGASGFELQALAEVGLGERVETFRASDGSWWEPGGRRLFAASQDRAVWLRQERADGGWTAVGLIRSRIWLEKQGASRAGARVELKLPELGASGLFEVVAVEPCPAIRARAGCVVTGMICHGAGRVYDLWLEGESAPLGVTSGHPIWSADRCAWVPAGALLAGECVQGVAGPCARVADGGARRRTGARARSRRRPSPLGYDRSTRAEAEQGYLWSLLPRAELAEFLLHRSVVWESMGRIGTLWIPRPVRQALDSECLRYARRVAGLVRKRSGALRARWQIGDGFDYPKQPSGERRWPGVPWPDGMERGTTINWEDAGAVRVRV